MRLSNVLNFFKEANSEMRRISWPTFKDLSSSSLLILFVVFVASLFFMMVDELNYRFINFILSLGR